LATLVPAELLADALPAAEAGLVPVLTLLPEPLELLEPQAASRVTAAIAAIGAIPLFLLCVIALRLHPNAHAGMRER
jgi:hypothetical protein